MNKNRLVWLVACIVAVLIAVGVVIQKQRVAYLTPSQQLAMSKQREGVMTAQDFTRLSQTTTAIEKSGVVSTPDLDWMLHLMQSKPLKDSVETRQALHTAVMFRLMEIKQFSPSQRDELLQSALPLLASDNKYDKKWGIIAASRTKDTQAIAHLKPLLADPDADVRSLASRAINKLKDNA